MSSTASGLEGWFPLKSLSRAASWQRYSATLGLAAYIWGKLSMNERLKSPVHITAIGRAALPRHRHFVTSSSFPDARNQRTGQQHFFAAEAFSLHMRSCRFGEIFSTDTFILLQAAKGSVNQQRKLSVGIFRGLLRRNENGVAVRW